MIKRLTCLVANSSLKLLLTLSSTALSSEAFKCSAVIVPVGSAGAGG